MDSLCLGYCFTVDQAVEKARLVYNFSTRLKTGMLQMVRTSVSVFSLTTYSFFHRLWIDGSSQETIQEDYFRIAQKAQLTCDDVVKSVSQWLSEMSRQGFLWLLVFDDLYDKQAIGKFLPLTTTGLGLVVVTSTKHFEGAGKALEVGSLEDEKAMDYLLQVAGKGDADQGERLSARKLVRLLDRLPIAINNAGSQIRKHKYSIQNFLVIWDKVFRETGHDDQWQTGRSLVATLEMSYRRVVERGYKYPIEILHFFAFLHSENASEKILLDAREALYKRNDWHGIPLSIFREVESAEHPLSVESFKYEIREALRVLHEEGLLEFDGNGGVRIHALIYHWLHHRLDSSQRQDWWKATATTVAVSITKDSTPNDKRDLIPHIDYLLNLDKKWVFDIHLYHSKYDFQAASLFADVYSVAGYFTKAYILRKGIYQRLEISRGTSYSQKDERRTTLIDQSLDLLAASCSDIGEHEEALRYRREAIGFEQEKGDKLDTTPRRLQLKLDEADSLWNLGHRDLASQVRVEVYESKSLSIPDQIFDFQQLRAERDYAISLCDNGNALKAAKLLETIVKRQSHNVETNDHQLLVSRSELARCYSEAGYEAKALSERQAIREFREADDASHHDTLIAMQDLANSFSKMKMTKDAYHLRREILERFKSSNRGILENHPSFLVAKYNLAQSLIETGHVNEALETHKAVLLTRLTPTASFKPSSEVIASLEAVSRTCHLLTRHEGSDVGQNMREALSYREQIVNVRRSLMCKDNSESIRLYLKARSDKLTLIRDLRDFSFSGSTLGTQNVELTGLDKLNYVIPLLEDILQERVQLLGDRHRDTLRSMDELGQAEFAKAAKTERRSRTEHYEKALEWFTKVDNVTIAPDAQKISAMKGLTTVYKKLGRLPDVIRILEALLEMQSEALGDNSVDTIGTAKRLWVEYRSWKHDVNADRKAELIATKYNLKKA